MENFVGINVCAEYFNCLILFAAVACPKLGVVEKGKILPHTCMQGTTFPGETCTVHCLGSRVPAPGYETFTCGDNLEWNPSVTTSQIYRACIKSNKKFLILLLISMCFCVLLSGIVVLNFSGIPRPFIKCPSNGYISATLPSGQSQMLVQIPRPHTNVDWWR